MSGRDGDSRTGNVYQLSSGHPDKIGDPLPVDAADLIVTGHVEGTQAHLFTNDSSLYSVYHILVKSTMKGPKEKVIDVDEVKGILVLPNGEKVVEGNLYTGFQRDGRTYLLLLKRNEDRQGAKLITAYEIRSDRVEPVNGNLADPKSPYKPFRWNATITAIYLLGVTLEGV